MTVSLFTRPALPANVSAVKYSESRSSQSDDEPTKKAVADRFSMWEKKTGDSLTPLRQANTPLRSTRATPAKQTGMNCWYKTSVNWPSWWWERLRFTQFKFVYTVVKVIFMPCSSVTIKIK